MMYQIYIKRHCMRVFSRFQPQSFHQQSVRLPSPFTEPVKQCLTQCSITDQHVSVFCFPLGTSTSSVCLPYSPRVALLSGPQHPYEGKFIMTLHTSAGNIDC